MSISRNYFGKLILSQSTLVLLPLGLMALVSSNLGCSANEAGNDPNAGTAAPVAPGAIDPNTGLPVTDPSMPGAVTDPTMPGAVTDPTMPGAVTDPTMPGAVAMPGPTGAPSATCGGSLPSAVVATCTGCHTVTGQANARYPDLYSFAGTVDDFKAKVRAGGTLMAAYPAALIADADLEAAFAYFTTTTRDGAVAVNIGGVVPLFSAADAVNPPAVTVRADGVIVTRGAGRVRGRHEKEGSFASFEPNYFHDRTYGFIIEDFTPTGQDLIRSTYLPITATNQSGNAITNWRSWKVRGDNATFQFNNYIPNATEADLPPETGTFVYNQIQQYDETQAPSGRAFAIGENYEFEIGIFIDRNSMVDPDSRNSYYTDCFRYRIGEGGLTPNNQDYEPAPGPVPQAMGGGDTTIAWILDEADIDQSIGQMALNIQPENVQNFVEGRRLFHTDFITGDHSELGNSNFSEHTNQAGPLFATTACTNCHLHNGPGTTVTTFSESTSMAFKLYNSGDLGNQLQLQEGTASLASTETKDVMLGDGTVVTLTKPIISLSANSGTVGGFSARVARKLVGLGLLEAITEETILSHADPLDCDQNGVSGRPLYVTDPLTGDLRIGRFGWKAEKVSVMHQVADAADADLGVSSTFFPEPGGGPSELTDEEVFDLASYMRLVGVYPQRNALDPAVIQGGQLFKTVGCNNCHITDAVTGPNHPFAELRNQSFKPYTDLLLHDMGPDLADNSNIDNSTLPADQQASAGPAASEWRTSPLSSLGFLATVGANAESLLHDGRAKSVLEAVLWHGGEATGVIENFKALPAAERDALIAFVYSL